MSINKNMDTMMQMYGVSYDKMWDFMFASLSNFSWTQEQAEKMVQTYIEQRKINRQEAAKITEEMLKQAKDNREKIREIVAEGIKAAFSENLFADYFKSGDIFQKIDDLEKKIEELKGLN